MILDFRLISVFCVVCCGFGWLWCFALRVGAVILVVVGCERLGYADCGVCWLLEGCLLLLVVVC